MRVGTQSRKLPNLTAFFPEWEVVPICKHRPITDGLDALAGWGHKAPGRLTQSLAQRRRLPYIALEDGFVRSYDLAVRGAAPWSLVMDDLGIYYDATGPSRLERLIAEAPIPPDAEVLMQRLRDGRISKYNCGALDAPLPTPGPYLLLIDQCRGDASVPLGMASETSFQQMLDDAARSGMALVVKTHPDVISGAREGFLASMPLPPGTVLVGDDINPYRLFEGAVAVHTVTSLLGMEALIAGLPVTCYGAPFYAGWGLTTDVALPAEVAARRTARPSLLQLFAASYLHYPRYIDPETSAASTLGATIDRMLQLRALYAARPARLHAWGFAPWKHPHVTPFLTRPGGQITFHHGLDDAVQAAHADATPLAIWAAKEPEGFAAEGIALLRVEDGFLRSRGLGSDLMAANSLSIDPVGIYYDATCPSALEQWLETAPVDEALLARAEALRAAILAAGVNKYNLGGEALPPLPEGKEIHLVIGQVEGDASLRCGGADIRTNAELLRAVRAAHPDGWILYKPHPDVLAGNRAKGDADHHAPEADQLVGDCALGPLLARVDRLHTITSLSGFEMLLRGGNVTTYGRPFYAGWGLTDDNAGPFPRRTRRLNLSMLVAGALIQYPSYYDWHTQLPTTPEHTVALLGSANTGAPQRPPKPSSRRQLRRFRRWLAGWLS